MNKGGHSIFYMGVSIVLPSITFIRDAHHAEVLILSSSWILLCVMSNFGSVLCANFSLSYVQFFVCVICGVLSVLCMFFRRVQHAQARVASLRSLRPLRGRCGRFAAAAGPSGPQMKTSAWCALLTEKQNGHTCMLGPRVPT